MPIKREWVEKAIQEENPNQKVIRMDEVSCENPAVGDNYTSAIKRVVIDVALDDGRTVRLPLIVKEIPTEGVCYQTFAPQGIFSTEIKAYKEILPLMTEVLAEENIMPFWPRFYGMKENYMILSDLKSKDFVIKCRRTRLDLEHTMLAIRALAQFHAASKVLEHRGKLDISGLGQPFLTRTTCRTFRNGGLKCVAKVILTQWGSQWKDIGQRLLENKTLSDKVEKLSDFNQSSMNVLCHGDLWTTNMLFKYSKSLNTPISVRFIDFQNVSYNSFAFDLLFFMGTSLPPDLRRKSKVMILRSYATALKRSLDSYGLSHLAPSLEEVLAEVKRLDPYYLFVLFAELPVCIADPAIENALDVGKMMSDEHEFAHNPKVYEGDFKKEVDEEILQWAEEGLF